MKKYIFLTNSIRNMGGAQMYLRNKLLFLQEHGWDVDVYFFTEGDIYIPELRTFEKNRIAILENPVYAVRSSERNAFLKSFLIKNKGYKKVVIESHVYHMCFWGELMASVVGGVNLIYTLHESYPVPTENERRFFLHKYQNGELVHSIERCEKLAGKLLENSNPNEFKIPSYSNVVSSEKCDFKYNKDIPSILSIGRLDKPYILPMIEEIDKYCIDAGQTVNLIFVGGAAENKYLNKIEDVLKTKHCILPVFLGYQYPICKNILDVADVAIASSGSILVPFEYGIPTIAIDIDSYESIGIYGYTTWNKWNRTNEPITSTSILLKQILIDKTIKKNEPCTSNQALESNREFEKQQLIIDKLKFPAKYYNVMKIYSFQDKFVYKIKGIVKGVVGVDNISRIRRIIIR